MTRTRRMVVVLLGLMLLGTVLVGTVWAKGITCTGGPCTGTKQADEIIGTAGADQIVGRRGNDVIAGVGRVTTGHTGNDEIRGGRGVDEIHVQDNDASHDVVDCGSGTDTVFFDVGKDILTNCEIKNPRV